MFTKQNFASLRITNTSDRNAIIALFLLLSINLSCTKETEEKPNDLIIIEEPYIQSYIDPVEPTDSVFFIRAKFEDTELNYRADDGNFTLMYLTSSGFGGMLGKGYSLRNGTTNEELCVMFYAPEENPVFSFKHANYKYGNPWGSETGPNVEFYTPTGEPDTFYRYLGSGITTVSFHITWFDEHRICGEFYARWVECCGYDSAFWVEGEFCIPRVDFE